MYAYVYIWQSMYIRRRRFTRVDRTQYISSVCSAVAHTSKCVHCCSLVFLHVYDYYHTLFLTFSHIIVTLSPPKQSRRSSPIRSPALAQLWSQFDIIYKYIFQYIEECVLYESKNHSICRLCYFGSLYTQIFRNNYQCSIIHVYTIMLQC